MVPVLPQPAASKNTAASEATSRVFTGRIISTRPAALPFSTVKGATQRADTCTPSREGPLGAQVDPSLLSEAP